MIDRSAQAPVLAIDGPSGAGKGTMARRLADRLGWHLLDSGALYRLVALAALRRGVDTADWAGLVELASTMQIEFGQHDGEERILLAGDDVSVELRGEVCGEAASRVAALPAVREALLTRQRGLARPPGLVADGRDMGTVVFPHAEVKIFLTASPEARAKRRHKQLKDKGIDVSLRGLSRDIAQRDLRDANRASAPLRAADDAWVIDSTNLTPEEVETEILSRLEIAGFGSSGA